MKKNYNPTDIHQKEGQEQSKKLCRFISEQIKVLDDARSCARVIGDLFKPTLQIHRSKFRDYCERLIFTNPLLHGRKGEELLWRKAFYEVIATSKRLKKQEYTSEEKANIESHINTGIGHYHHFIARLHQEYDLQLQGTVDFIVTDNVKKINEETVDVNLTTWGYLSVHRSLIYLGDLCRYKLDIYPNWDQNLALRYYLQALYFKPEYGMPHNQMGTLASNLNNNLEAAYHYIRSLDCKHTFEGTENNLHRLFEKNSHYLEQLPVENADTDSIVQLEPAEHVKRFISRFLLLIDIWYFNKKITHIYDLCHRTYIDLQECMTYLKPLTNGSVDTPTDVDNADTDSTTSPAYLSSDVIFKIISICLLCIHKHKSIHLQLMSNIVPFTLAVYSQLVQTIIAHIQEGILNFPLPPVENWLNKNVKRHLKKRRRRKILCNNNSDEEQDSSNAESADEIDSESEEFIISDNEGEAIEDETSSDEDEYNNKPKEIKTNGINDADKSEKSSTDEGKSNEEILKKCKQMEVRDILVIIGDENLLPCVKILNDWLMSNVEILKYCGKSARSLLNQIVNLINLINVDNGDSKLKDMKTALPEDVMLKGVEILADIQKDIDWSSPCAYGTTIKDFVSLRIMKMVSFGHFLTTISETGVSYDAKKKLFTVKMDEVCTNGINEFDLRDVENGDSEIIKKLDDAKIPDPKGQLMKMKHMGQLWLTAEVKDLESRVKGKPSLSPYLVLDADALIVYTSMVKQLVYSRKFIVLVPSAVVSALDDLKREKLEARDAIRWLESQFHHGNRFFRAQRPQERLPIPYIKYPKKKDKETFIYIQIIECCHFLTQQQKGATNLVTLLTGNASVLSNGENREISYVGLAQSAGVNLESITEFYTKWKKTVKGKR